MNINLTILGQVISFAIFVWFCMKYVWPALIAAMEERQKKIADGLDAADRAMRDLELAQDKATDQLKEAKIQAAALIDEAKKRSAQIIEESKERAREEGERLKVAAQADIDQELNRAREELRGQLATLVVTGAEKILQRSIDQNAHRDLIDQLAAQL